MKPDINQEAYSLPEYLDTLHASWLNESWTLLRRHYYKNDSHGGFILYTTDAAQRQSDVGTQPEALKNSKGLGNFRNLFMYAPNGNKESIHLIPVSEGTTKGEFFKLDNVTRDDLLAAHRIPPQLMGPSRAVPVDLAATDKAAEVFSLGEIAPLRGATSSTSESRRGHALQPIFDQAFKGWL